MKWIERLRKVQRISERGRELANQLVCTNWPNQLTVSEEKVVTQGPLWPNCVKSGEANEKDLPFPCVQKSAPTLIGIFLSTTLLGIVAYILQTRGSWVLSESSKAYSRQSCEYQTQGSNLCFSDQSLWSDECTGLDTLLSQIKLCLNKIVGLKFVYFAFSCIIFDMYFKVAWASLVSQMVKNPPAMQETRV